MNKKTFGDLESDKKVFTWSRTWSTIERIIDC